MTFAIFTVFLFSFSAIFATRTSKTLGNNNANFSRMVPAVLILGIYAHIWGQGWGGAGFGMLFLSGVLGFGIGDAAMFQALTRIGSRITVLIVQCLAAPLAALTEWLWMGISLTPAQMLWGSVILLGVSIALIPTEKAKADLGAWMWGLFFALIGAVGQGGGAVLSRKAYMLNDAVGLSIDGSTATYQRLLGGILFAGCIWLIMRRNEPKLPTFKNPIWVWVVANAFAGPILGVSCYQWALKTTPSGVVLPIVATTPLAIMPLALWLEKERLSKRGIFGGLIAVIGVIKLTIH